MDVYGYLMAREGHLEDVEVLGGRLFNISDQHAEPWVISGWVWGGSLNRPLPGGHVDCTINDWLRLTWDITILLSFMIIFEFVSIVQLSQLLQQALLQSSVPRSQGHPAEQQQRAGSPPEGGSTKKHGSCSRSHYPFQRGYALGALPTRLLRRYVCHKFLLVCSLSFQA